MCGPCDQIVDQLQPVVDDYSHGNAGMGAEDASSTNDDVEEDPTGTKSLWDRGLLSGAGQKADCIAVTHIGETIVSLTKAALIPGGSDSLVYTTLSGTVGMVVPFTSNEDHDFFQHLEMHMRGENPPMCGR